MAITKCLPALNVLTRITLSCPDKVQRKIPFLCLEIKTRPFRFVRLCVAPEVHLKEAPHQNHGNT